MMDLREFSRRFEESRPFHELLNIACFIDSEVFLTKDGSVGLVLRDVGIDEDCLEPARIDLLVSKRVAALRAFDDRFDISQYILKRSSPPADTPVFKNPALNRAAESRTAFFKQKGVDLYSFENYLVVISKLAWASPRLLERLSHLAKNPRKAFRTSFTGKGKVKALDEPLEKAVRTLRQAVSSFIQQLGDDVHLQKASKAFRLFRRLVNPCPTKADAVGLTHDQHVDFFAVDSELEAHRDHLRLDNYFLKLLTLKAPPCRTFANMLGELRRIKSDLVIVSNWNHKDTARAVAAIRSQRRHHHNLKVSILSHMTSEQPSERAILYDGSKEALVENLGECLTEIELKGSLIQEYSLTIKIIADSLEAAERASAEAMKVLGKYEGALNEERYNLLNAYLATLPGGYPFNLRKILLTNRNVADMALWFLPSAGDKRSSFLDAPALATFETLDNPPCQYR
jgi:type IV secretion system protein TrbE